MQHLKQLAFTGCTFSFAVVSMSFSRQLTVRSVDGGGARFELSDEITDDSALDTYAERACFKDQYRTMLPAILSRADGGQDSKYWGARRW